MSVGNIIKASDIRVEDIIDSNNEFIIYDPTTKWDNKIINWKIIGKDQDGDNTITIQTEESIGNFYFYWDNFSQYFYSDAAGYEYSTWDKELYYYLNFWLNGEGEQYYFEALDINSGSPTLPGFLKNFSNNFKNNIIVIDKIYKHNDFKLFLPLSLELGFMHDTDYWPLSEDSTAKNHNHYSNTVLCPYYYYWDDDNVGKRRKKNNNWLLRNNASNWRGSTDMEDNADKDKENFYVNTNGDLATRWIPKELDKTTPGIGVSPICVISSNTQLKEVEENKYEIIAFGKNNSSSTFIDSGEEERMWVNEEELTEIGESIRKSMNTNKKYKLDEIPSLILNTKESEENNISPFEIEEKNFIDDKNFYGGVINIDNSIINAHLNYELLEKQVKRSERKGNFYIGKMEDFFIKNFDNETFFNNFLKNVYTKIGEKLKFNKIKIINAQFDSSTTVLALLLPNFTCKVEFIEDLCPAIIYNNKDNRFDIGMIAKESNNYICLGLMYYIYSSLYIHKNNKNGYYPDQTGDLSQVSATSNYGWTISGLNQNTESADNLGDFIKNCGLMIFCENMYDFFDGYKFSLCFGDIEPKDAIYFDYYYIITKGLDLGTGKEVPAILLHNNSSELLGIIGKYRSPNGYYDNYNTPSGITPCNGYRNNLRLWSSGNPITYYYKNSNDNFDDKDFTFEEESDFVKTEDVKKFNEKINIYFNNYKNNHYTFLADPIFLRQYICPNIYHISQLPCKYGDYDLLNPNELSRFEGNHWVTHYYRRNVLIPKFEYYISIGDEIYLMTSQKFLFKKRKEVKI